MTDAVQNAPQNAQSRSAVTDAETAHAARIKELQAVTKRLKFSRKLVAATMTAAARMLGSLARRDPS